MAVSESRKKANRKWIEAHRDRYWACYLRFPAADREVIFERASALGVTVSDYIRNLMYADIDVR